MVVIVLLNVLIAQVSDTYTKVLATAPEVYLSHQCWYMARIEQQRYAACLPCLFRHMLRWCARRIVSSVSLTHCIYKPHNTCLVHKKYRASWHNSSYLHLEAFTISYQDKPCTP